MNTITIKVLFMKKLVANKFLKTLYIMSICTLIACQKNSNLSGPGRSEKVKREDLIQRVTIAGNIVPEKKTIVTAPFNGYVKKLFVEVGSKVKKDAPLVSVVQSLQSTDHVYPLRAPFDGVVVQVQRYEGEFVKQDDNKDFILRIDGLENLYILSDVPEIDMTKIKIGQEVLIKVTAILDRSFKGVVEKISLASKLQDDWRGNSKVEYPTLIKILDADKKIRPGMSTILDIVTDRKKNVLVLPHEFILKEGEKYYVLTSNNKRKEIKIGAQNETSYEIVEGVLENEVVNQVDFLKMLTSKTE